MAARQIEEIARLRRGRNSHISKVQRRRISDQGKTNNVIEALLKEIVMAIALTQIRERERTTNLTVIRRRRRLRSRNSALNQTSLHFQKRTYNSRRKKLVMMSRFR